MKRNEFILMISVYGLLISTGYGFPVIMKLIRVHCGELIKIQKVESLFLKETENVFKL